MVFFFLLLFSLRQMLVSTMYIIIVGKKACFKSIYPNILTLSRFRWICLINRSYFRVINKTRVASCLEVRKKAYLYMILTPQSFLIVTLIINSPVSKLNVSLTVTLHTTYLTGQEVDQTFVTTCKSMIGLVNLLINKRLKCLSFYNTLAKLGSDFCYISLTQLVSLPLDKLQLLLGGSQEF